jgi:hypothetical protein
MRVTAPARAVNSFDIIWLHPSNLDISLPRDQRNQWDRSRFRHVKICRLQRNIIFIDRNKFGECSDPVIAWPRVDCVADHKNVGPWSQS